MLTVRSVQKGNKRGRGHVAPTLASAIAAVKSAVSTGHSLSMFVSTAEAMATGQM